MNIIKHKWLNKVKAGIYSKIVCKAFDIQIEKTQATRNS